MMEEQCHQHYHVKLHHQNLIVKQVRCSTGLIIFLLIMFMYIGADLFYGVYVEQVRSIITIYLIFYLFSYMYTQKKPSTIEVAEQKSYEGWTSFIIGFLGTAIALFAIIGISPWLLQMFTNIEIPIGAFSIAALGFGALHGFIKAYIEEEIFRNQLPRAGFGDIWSAIIFGAFHLGVLFAIRGLTLSVIWFPVLVLIFLGLGWAIMRNYIGIMGSTGSHFAWNMFAMGILFSVISGGIV